MKAEKDKKFKLAYLLAFGSGLRISEIVGLREYECKCGEDIHSYITEDKKKRFRCVLCGPQKLNDLKRSKTRWKYKPIESSQIDLQTKQIKVFGKGGKERITLVNPDYPLKDYMLTLLPLKIERRTLQNRFKAACVKGIGKPLNFHTLRHGFANYMLNEKGYPMPVVQGFGGWVRLDTVGLYAKANPQSAIDKIWGNN